MALQQIQDPCRAFTATTSRAQRHGSSTVRGTICSSSQSDPSRLPNQNQKQKPKQKSARGEAVILKAALLPNGARADADSRSAGSRGVWQEMLSAAFDAAERLIPLIEPRETERTFRTDPRMQLGGNFAPVEECPPQAVLEVTGTIPACLNGAYVRNGGNPRFAPAAGFHFFDGDGMLHVVRIRDGGATYCCRFVRTNRLEHEERIGRPQFPKALGELQGWGGIARLTLFFLRDLTGLLDWSRGLGVANAGLEFFNGMLLAISEDDKPYALRVTDDGDVETLGRYDFGGALQTAMTAHPKIDPRTGELFAFGYNVLRNPYLSYFRVTPDGVKSPDVPITLPEPALIHDWAITENYAIFPEGHMVFRAQELFVGRSPIVIDPAKQPRFGVLARTATSATAPTPIRWFSVPAPALCFHYLNAWESFASGDEEIIVAGSSLTPLTTVFDKPGELQGHVHLFRLNLTTGQASKHQVCAENLEAGRCNAALTGRRARYAYMSMYGPWPRYSGVAKVDLGAEGAPVAWRKFGEGRFCSEPCFVGRSDDGDEDDGYVVTHCHDESAGVSELLILDARSPTLATVASVRLPARVPYGFHGTFLTEQQLASQRSSLP